VLQAVLLEEIILTLMDVEAVEQAVLEKYPHNQFLLVQDIQ
jgi:hypothetical protein